MPRLKISEGCMAVRHLFPDFLDNPQSYAGAVNYWLSLWARIEEFEKDYYSWQQPWLNAGPDAIMDGNPIFSAFTPTLSQGIRIIQHPPTSGEIEFEFWPDTFGGRIMDA